MESNRDNLNSWTLTLTNIHRHCERRAQCVEEQVGWFEPGAEFSWSLPDTALQERSSSFVLHRYCNWWLNWLINSAGWFLSDSIKLPFIWGRDQLQVGCDYCLQLYDDPSGLKLGQETFKVKIWIYKTYPFLPLALSISLLQAVAVALSHAVIKARGLFISYTSVRRAQSSHQSQRQWCWQAMTWTVGTRELKSTKTGIKINCTVAPNALVLINWYTSVLCPTLLISSSHLELKLLLHQALYGSLVMLQPSLSR